MSISSKPVLAGGNHKNCSVIFRDYCNIKPTDFSKN